MSNKNKVDLKIDVNNSIKPNNNNEVTANILNGILVDFIDSFQVESGTTSSGSTYVNQRHSSLNILGNNTNIVNIYLPKGEIIIYINGVKESIGSLDTDRLYFMKSGIVQDKMNIASNSTLYYNSTALGFILDTSDTIELTYII